MKNKALISVVGVIVAAVIAIGCCIGFGVFSFNDIKGLFTKKHGGGNAGNKDTSVPVAITDSGEWFWSHETYALPRAMTFTMSEQDKPEYVSSGELIITATSTNEYINGEYEFSAEWENPSNEWASGKVADSYLIITPVEGSADKAKITVSEPFGEPIIVTAKLVGNGSEGTDGTCKIDYLKRLTFSKYVSCPDFGDCACVTGEYAYGVGTVQNDDCIMTVLSLNPTEEFVSNFQSFLKFDVDLKGYSFYNCSAWMSQGDFDFSFSDDLEYSMFVVGFNELNSNQQQAIYYAWNKAYKLSKFNMLLDFNIDCFYNGAIVGSVSETDLSGVGEVSGNFYYDEYVNVNVLLNGGYVF